MANLKIPLYLEADTKLRRFLNTITFANRNDFTMEANIPFFVSSPSVILKGVTQAGYKMSSSVGRAFFVASFIAEFTANTNVLNVRFERMFTPRFKEFFTGLVDDTLPCIGWVASNSVLSIKRYDNTNFLSDSTYSISVSGSYEAEMLSNG